MTPDRDIVKFRGIVVFALCILAGATGRAETHSLLSEESPNQVLEWNQILIDTLVATNTPNSSSQRLGAIVHTAIYDAYNSIEGRYSPVFVQQQAPPGASRRAAVIAAAYTALSGLFPSRQSALDAGYAASLAALSNEGDGGRSRELGISWGTQVAEAVLVWRAADGFNAAYPPFTGGSATGQWRPTPPAFGAMSAQGLAFTETFALDSNHTFQPTRARGLMSMTYSDDFNAVKALGRRTGSTRTEDQTLLAVFWEGNASVHWNQAANQIARTRHLSMSASNRLLAVLNIAMADTAFTTWSAKRFYGSVPTDVTWRPVTAIPLADTDDNPDTSADPDWIPLINTPSHPEFPAGHPSLNGAAATVLLSRFADEQTFTLTTGQVSRTYTSITQARSDGNNARIWGGMHFPSTVRISDAEGESIANHVNQNSMTLRRNQERRTRETRAPMQFLDRVGDWFDEIATRTRGTVHHLMRTGQASKLDSVKDTFRYLFAPVRTRLLVSTSECSRTHSTSALFASRTSRSIEQRGS